MSSIIKVDQIQLADGSTPTAGDLGLNTTGSVLQVVQAVRNNGFSFASSDFTDLTGLSVSITPKSTSSKILVTCMVHATAASDNHSIAYRVLRGSTPVGVGEADGSRKQASFMDATHGGGDHLAPACYTYLDSPSTTDQITYKIQGATESGGNAEINRNEASNNNDSDAKFSRPISTITLTEIAG